MDVEMRPLMFIFEPTTQVASRARATVRDCLPSMIGDQASDAVLMASELVTNAVLHGAGPVVLSVGVGRGLVRVEASDSSATVPRVRPRADGEGGRGMVLIDSLSTRWGVCDRQDAQPGKTVWFELSLGPDSPRPP
ncbi:MAG TPA: ATP-binding protein [Mycobacteriales bacterium]|nr:ATP-binding protein [Mycobacteriales bacterium]